MYDRIVQYAKILYDRNLKSFGTITTVTDIICEVYAIGYSSEEDVVKVVSISRFKETSLVNNMTVEKMNQYIKSLYDDEGNST